MRSLYLCYFGLREPLVQTQVLPYLRRLAAQGSALHLLTFEGEAWSDDSRKAWRERLADEGIQWHRLPYHKRPSVPATLYDIAIGAARAAFLTRRHGIQLLHARSHVAAAMGLLAKQVTGARLLFDIRGFLPEEYVDAGLWRDGGLRFRGTKAVERHLMAGADGFVVLTKRAQELLFPGCDGKDARGRPVEVIPCCVDSARFEAAAALPRAELRASLGFSGRRVLAYVGALGGWYLTEELVRFLAVAHRQDAATFSLVLTQSDPAQVREPLLQQGVPECDFLVRKVAPEEVPRYLHAADLAVSFIKPSYSKLASSPTKLAEYLASGLPVLCNAGIGDVDAVIEEDRVGVLMQEFTPDAFRRALAAADALRREPESSDRCRASARRRFDLQTVGGARYERLYRRLLGERGGERPLAAGLTVAE